MKDFITDKLFNIDGLCGFKCCLRTLFLKEEAWHIQYIGMYETNLLVSEDVAFCVDNHIQLCLCIWPVGWLLCHKGHGRKRGERRGHGVQSGMNADLEWIGCQILSRWLAAVYVLYLWMCVCVCGLWLCLCVFWGREAGSGGVTPLHWSC